MQKSRSASQDVVDLYVGRRLKLIRRQKHMSQKELAERLGITFQQVQKYEKGLNRLPAGRMLGCCFALDITPNDLFKDLLSKEYPPKDTTEYTEEEVEIIDMLRGLNKPLKSQVKQIVGTLAGQ